MEKRLKKMENQMCCARLATAKTTHWQAKAPRPRRMVVLSPRSGTSNRTSRPAGRGWGERRRSGW